MENLLIMDKELMACVGDLIDPSYKLNPVTNDVTPEVTHFSEYSVGYTKLPEELVNRFNKHIRKPTQEEYEQYSIKRAKEEEELRKRIEESEKYGPAFLSDEWRWARIDAEVDRCREFVKKYG
jgi:preprotein translocase subunit Sss1